MKSTQIFNASEARKNLYSLIRQAGKGAKTFEIQLRGNDPVILMSKSELEAWQETLDILTNPNERQTIRAGKKTKKTVSHKQMLKSLGLSNDSSL